MTKATPESGDVYPLHFPLVHFYEKGKKSGCIVWSRQRSNLSKDPIKKSALLSQGDENKVRNTTKKVAH